MMSTGRNLKQGKESYSSMCARAPNTYCVFIRRIDAGVTTDELESFLLLRLNRSFSKEFSQRVVDSSIKNIKLYCSSNNQNSLMEAVIEFKDNRCSAFALNLRKTQLRNQIMEIRPIHRRLFVYNIPLDATAPEVAKKIQDRLCLAFSKKFSHTPSISVSFVESSLARNNFQAATMEFDNIETADFVLRLRPVVLRGEVLSIKPSFKNYDAKPDSLCHNGDLPNKRQRCTSKEEIIGSTGCALKHHERNWKNPVDDDEETIDVGIDRNNLATKYRSLVAENVAIEKTLSHLQEENESLVSKIKKSEQAERESSSRLLELEEDLRLAVDDGTVKQLELEREVEKLQKAQKEMERLANEAISTNHELEVALSVKKQHDMDQSKIGDSEIHILRSQLRDSERRFLELTQCFTEQSRAFAQERREFRDEVNRERTRSETLESKLKELRSPHVDLSVGPTVPTVKEERD
jgi:hypothetical protein